MLVSWEPDGGRFSLSSEKKVLAWNWFFWLLLSAVAVFACFNPFYETADFSFF